MIIKRYLVRDMSQAMTKIREELGSEAIIVSNRRIRQKGIKNIFKKKVLEVTAVVDQKKNYAGKKDKEVVGQDKRPPVDPVKMDQKEMDIQEEAKIQEENSTKNLKEEIDELSKILHELMETNTSNEKEEQVYPIGNKTIEPLEPMRLEPGNTWINSLDTMMLDEGIIEGFAHFCREQNIYSNINDSVLHQYFQKMLEENTFKQEGVKERIWAFVGPTGVGKTTTIAKVAARETINKGKSVGLITLDTYRIGAVEQLRTYANILDIPLEVVFTKADLERAIEKLKDCDLILIDSTGRSSLNQAHLQETKDLLDVLDQNMNILVASASTPKSDLKTIVDNYNFISYDYVILTKVDETKNYGNIFNVGFYAKRPLLFITTGQSVPDDIQEASTQRLLDYISSEVVS